MKVTSIFAIALTVVTVAPAHANYFKDDFSWGYKSGIWQARDGSNGSPFGCKFTPSKISPSSHGITLNVAPNQCAELRTKSLLSYGKVQSSLKTGNARGTVSSIFTYTSWHDVPGRAWQEIDIEFLPSLGNVVHTNLIYQPQGGQYQSWEQDIDLGQYGLNIHQDMVHIGFDWSSWKIDWYLIDSSGNTRIIRSLYKDNGDGYVAANEVPQYAWPVDPTRIMINHWHGDNSADAQYFPQEYFNQNNWAYYDYLEYTPK
ncbi:beta-glucanase [Agarivorans sp. Toyoura001]|uniref:family 16 glycosylhydrolase n=1 Tax=Agarivorans sp. Toyoura001 TaxID=2283141 RepID=UPI0010D2B06E|nr:family 16 glycosylhydrolase [Agarivorans sp. Toyoura001]GDY25933.1 beta-glucanase [Agarivorans sp. Toyoura001]